MKNPATIPRVDGAFPVVTIRSDTAPGLKDGTPLHKYMGDDLLAALQTVLNSASLTPSGTADTCGTTAGDVTGSQFFEALQLALAVPGEIVGLPTATIPTGARLLALTGQTVSLTTYPRLINVWCGAGDNPTAPAYYRTSDAGGTTRNAAGGYLKLDDLRGLFLRGLDTSGAIDPDGATREFGDMQADGVGPHVHDNLYNNVGYPPGTEYTTMAVAAGAGGYGFEAAGTGHMHTGNSGTDIIAESRPLNSCVTWCIRY